MALRRRSARGRGGAGRSHDLFPGFGDVVEIGAGRLATVFRARELDTQRLVALKLLNLRDASPRSIESFERESVALGALSSHPNIVTLYRNFRTPDARPVLVLELCAGAVADRLYDGDSLPVADAVAIGVKIAGALETAHRGGILHRDVKPQNILVTEFGEPALADFGVAMLQSSTQTAAGLFDFTTLHAAPELLEGGGTSAATDVYELASSLYQLIAGQSAFRAYEGESPASVILRILRDPVRPLSGAGVALPLSDLLIRAMSKDKAERPATAAEFAAELAQVEIAQGWSRTQFLIRGAASDQHSAGVVTRMPDQVAALPPVSSAPRPAQARPMQLQPQPATSGERGWWPPRAAPAPDWGPATGHASTASGPAAEVRWGRTTFVSHPVAPEPALEQQPARPAAHPGAADESARPEFPAPPAHSVPDPAARRPGAGVPVWATRTAALHPTSGTRFAGNLVIDPSSLSPRLTVRSGSYRLTVDERRLRLRRFLRSEHLPWSQITGFQLHFPSGVGSPQSAGMLVAITTTGAVELRATKRAGPELRRLHALLDAYRLRAGTRATN